METDSPPENEAPSSIANRKVLRLPWMCAVPFRAARSVTSTLPLHQPGAREIDHAHRCGADLRVFADDQVVALDAFTVESAFKEQFALEFHGSR